MNEWVTDERALLTIRTLGLQEGDEVRLDFPDSAQYWSGVELHIIKRAPANNNWEVGTIKPSHSGATAVYWDPSTTNWKLIAWRRPK